MTGTFELFTDENLGFRFRLKAPDGTVMALSRSFPDKAAAVAGITAVREYAGMGLITDLPRHPRPRTIGQSPGRGPDHSPTIPGGPFSRCAAARDGHRHARKTGTQRTRP